ncbi:hypothetical protein SLS62_011297 [Diatrype stigma]|uniref:Apple domain-containing protein n=1 Tax=Diatrype stigma TaxID=117547 RepID=A0AAN9U669_9PEZI
MLRQLIASAAVFGALVTAAHGTTATSYSAVTNSGCSTEFGSGATAVPTSIPVLNTLRTVSTVVTDKEVTVPATSKVTAAAVTQTVRTETRQAYVEVTSTLPEYDVYVLTDGVIGTATIPTTVCTAGAKQPPSAAATAYSGTYAPVSGQVQTVPASYATKVVCETAVTIFTRLVPTATSGKTTVTVTPTSTVTSITTTVTLTGTYSTVAYLSTVTKTQTHARVASTTTTISASCATSPTTTTYAAKCAPTNVIWGIEDRGLVPGDYADSAIVYVDGDEFLEPSACCQLCADNESCAAMMAGGGSYCGLLYNAVAGEGDSACGKFIYSYKTESGVSPGQGIYVQSGCGNIEYAGNVGS